MTQRNPRSVERGLGLAVVLGVALAHAWPYRASVTDDALISLRYARRLLSGHGLTWTDAGRPVEGYSDLLWVLLCAALGGLGIDLVVAAQLLGALGLVAAVVAVSVDPDRPGEASPVRTWTGGLALALSPSIAAWAVYGLEHTFLAGLFAWTTLLLVRRVERDDRAAGVGAAVLLGAIVLTRLDGVVLFAGLCLGVVGAVGPRKSVRVLAPIAAVPVACLLAQQAFRVGYHGDWVANTARVKVSMTLARTWNGVTWVARGLGRHGVLLVAAVAACVAGRPPRARVVIPATAGAVWCAYVAWVGGDIFPSWRQLVPALPALAMLISEGAAGLRLPRWAFVGVAAVAALHLLVARSGPDAVRAGTWPTVAGARMGGMLKEGWGELRPLLAVDAAGALPYWSELPALDMLGLTNGWLARHRPQGFGGAGIGHDLGHGDFVWSQEPDIIAFRGLGSTRPKFKSGVELFGMPDFRLRYQRVEVQNGLETATLYVRRDGGRLGLSVWNARIDVPGWFFASAPATLSLVDGELVTPVGRGVIGRVPELDLPAGTWRIEADPSLEVQVVCESEPTLRALGRRTVVELPEPQRIDLLASPRADGAVVPVTGVSLLRTRERPTLRCPPRPRTTLGAGEVTFDERGIDLVVPDGLRADRFTIALDRDDDHVLWWWQGGERVAVKVLRASAGEGLQVHSILTPSASGSDGADRLELRPTDDGVHLLGIRAE